MSFIFLSFFGFSIFAQSYKTAVGIRAGLPLGVSFKYFTSEQTGFEFMAGSRWKGFTLVGLYEHHKPTNLYPGLKWYFGGGAEIGIYGQTSPWVYEPGNQLIFGIVGIIGTEYTFDDFPLNLSFDWVPLFNMLGFTCFDYLQFGVSARYVF